MTENGGGAVLLDRLSDRFFKYLFAREEHKDLLIAFLNEVLLDLNPDGSARRIEDVTYRDRESSPLHRERFHGLFKIALVLRRRAFTLGYELSPPEAALYEAVTEYVQKEFNRADQLQGEHKATVGFALTILQRRLADRDRKSVV